MICQKALEDSSSSVKGAWVTFLGLWCHSTAVWVAQTTEIPSLSSAGWKSKVTVWAGLVFLEVQQVDGTQALSSVWWWPATLAVQLVQSLPPSAQSCPPPMSLHACLSPFSHKDASHIGSGPMLTQCIFKLTNYICKDSTPAPAHPYRTGHCSATSEQTCEEGMIAVVIL